MYLVSSYIISYFLCASLKEPYLGGKNMLLGLYSVREGFAHIYCSTNVFPWRAKSLMFSFCFLQFAAKICLLTSFRDTCFVEIVPQYQTPQRGKVLFDYYLLGFSIVFWQCAVLPSLLVNIWICWKTSHLHLYCTVVQKIGRYKIDWRKISWLWLLTSKILMFFQRYG